MNLECMSKLSYDILNKDKLPASDVAVKLFSNISLGKILRIKLHSELVLNTYFLYLAQSLSMFVTFCSSQ